MEKSPPSASGLEAIKVEGLTAEQCVVLLVTLLPILTEYNQEITPGSGPSNSRENDSSNEGTVAMIWEEGVINAPPRSPTPAARTVSFLMDHQLEPAIRTLQTARLRDQELMFWSMQGSISADSFGRYRLELAIDLTEEEGDQMVHQLAGLWD